MCAKAPTSYDRYYSKIKRIEMRDQQQKSPVETPTTPSAPSFPPFPLVTSFSPRRSSVISNATMRRRSSSTLSIPSSPLENTISRPIPIRPSKVTKASSPTASATGPKQGRLRLKPPLPNYHLRVVTLLPRPAQSSAFKRAVSHLKTPLVPLISVTSGLPHPAFPTSLLQFHLLTHEKLDELAHFYHQVTPPVPQTFRYPTHIPTWVTVNANGKTETREVDLETKRRRWGRFTGLKGCETPMETGKEEGLQERMEREWQRALERATDEKRLREKGWRDPW